RPADAGEGAPRAPDGAVHEQGAERLDVEARAERGRERQRRGGDPDDPVFFGDVDWKEAELVRRRDEPAVAAIHRQREVLALEPVEGGVSDGGEAGGEVREQPARRIGGPGRDATAGGRAGP